MHLHRSLRRLLQDPTARAADFRWLEGCTRQVCVESHFFWLAHTATDLLFKDKKNWNNAREGNHLENNFFFFRSYATTGVMVGVHPRARHSENHQQDLHAALEGHAKDRSSHATTCLRCLPEDARHAWRGVVVSTVESGQDTLVVLRAITSGTLSSSSVNAPTAAERTSPSGSPSTAASLGTRSVGFEGKEKAFLEAKLRTVPASQLRPLFPRPQDSTHAGRPEDKPIARCSGRGGTCRQLMAQLPAHGRNAGLQCLRPECCVYIEGMDGNDTSLQPVYLCSDCAHDRARMVPDAVKQVLIMVSMSLSLLL